MLMNRKFTKNVYKYSLQVYFMSNITVTNAAIKLQTLFLWFTIDSTNVLRKGINPFVLFSIMAK